MAAWYCTGCGGPVAPMPGSLAIDPRYRIASCPTCEGQRPAVETAEAAAAIVADRTARRSRELHARHVRDGLTVASCGPCAGRS